MEDIYESPDVAQQIESVRDPTKAIVDAAFDAGRNTPRCRATIEMFVSILGSEAGNLALKVLATGGIYLAGGVAVHTLRALREPGFMKAFTDKGRLSDLLKRVPVHVNDVDNRRRPSGLRRSGVVAFDDGDPGRANPRGVHALFGAAGRVLPGDAALYR